MPDYVFFPPSFSKLPGAEKIVSYLDTNAMGAVSVDSLEKIATTLSSRIAKTQSFQQFLSYGRDGLQSLSYIDDDTRKMHALFYGLYNMCHGIASLVTKDNAIPPFEETKEQLRFMNSFLQKLREGELPSVSKAAMEKALAAPRETLDEILETLENTASQIGTPAWQQKIDQALAKDAEWLTRNRDQLMSYISRGTPYSADLLQFQEMRIRNLLSSHTYPPSITQWLEDRLQGTVDLRRDHVVETFRDNQTLGSLQQGIEQQTGLQQFRAGLPMVSPNDPSVIQVPIEFKAPHLNGNNDFLRGYLSLQKPAVESFTAGFPLESLNARIYLEPDSTSQLTSSATSVLNPSICKGAAIFLSALDSDKIVENTGELAAKTAVGSTPPGRLAVALYELAQMMVAEDRPQAGQTPMAAPPMASGLSQGMSRG